MRNETWKGTFYYIKESRRRYLINFIIRAVIVNILILIIVFFAHNLVFAEIPIYCPKCKTHLYDYKYDTIEKGKDLKAKDFICVDDVKPFNDGVCPLDGSPLNGWEYYGKISKFKSMVFAYKAISLLSKNKEGKWIWLPYDVPMLDFNKENKETIKEDE